MSMELEKAGLDRFQRIINIANKNPIFCKETDNIIVVLDSMLNTGHRRLPVVSKNQEVVGVISLMDILSAYLRKQKFSDSASTIMSRDVIFCNENDTLDQVLQKFKFSRRGGFPILKNRKLIGIITERDIVKHFSNVSFGMKIEDVMTKKPFFVNSNTSILDCLKSIVNTRYRRLPVVKNSKLIGVETGTDILNYLKENNYSEQSLMKPVESVMIRDVVSITRDKDILDAINLMRAKDVGGLPVVNENGMLEGFITERDILEEIV